MLAAREMTFYKIAEKDHHWSNPGCLSLCCLCVYNQWAYTDNCADAVDQLLIIFIFYFLILLPSDQLQKNPV